jgi:hypothetical protein
MLSLLFPLEKIRALSYPGMSFPKTRALAALV